MNPVHSLRNKSFLALAVLWVLFAMAPSLVMTTYAQSIILDAVSGHAIAGAIARIPMEAFIRGGVLPTRIVIEGAYDGKFLELDAVVPGAAATAAKKNVSLTLNVSGRFRVEVVGDCVNG